MPGQLSPPNLQQTRPLDLDTNFFQSLLGITNRRRNNCSGVGKQPALENAQRYLECGPGGIDRKTGNLRRGGSVPRQTGPGVSFSLLADLQPGMKIRRQLFLHFAHRALPLPVSLRHSSHTSLAVRSSCAVIERKNASVGQETTDRQRVFPDTSRSYLICGSLTYAAPGLLEFGHR